MPFLRPGIHCKKQYINKKHNGKIEQIDCSKLLFYNLYVVLLLVKSSNDGKIILCSYMTENKVD